MAIGLKNIIVLLMTLLQGAVMAKNIALYLGTYTGRSPAEGIYYAELDLSSGQLDKFKLAVKTDNPSFITIHPSGKFLYAVAEKRAGEVKAFAINRKTKELQLLNQRSSHGSSPCHLVLDNGGKYLFVANYSSGSIAVFPIKADGSLAKASSVIQHKGASITKRQRGPHPHCIVLSPDNRFVYVADLGLDKIMIYRFDAATGRLQANNPPFIKLKPGTGPRHLAFHPNGKFLYLISELEQQITLFRRNRQTGALTMIQNISTLPADFKGSSWCAEVMVDPRGQFLYGSNRGHDSIVIYRIDQSTGKLKLLGYQTQGIDNPRHFNITPDGSYCLVGNQDDDNIVVFKVARRTGLLQPTSYSLNIGKPVCIKFLKR